MLFGMLNIELLSILEITCEMVEDKQAGKNRQGNQLAL